MTGAIHEDGLADTCDGLGGGATRERALEIMKDPRIGVFGTIALILTLLLKIAALSLMPLWTAMAALLAAHAFSRFCAVIVIFAGRYVGSAERSRAAPVVERVTIGDVLIAALFGLPALVLCGRGAIVAIVVALVLLGLLVRWCVQRIGGYTGDTLGRCTAGHRDRRLRAHVRSFSGQCPAHGRQAARLPDSSTGALS